MSCDFLFPLDDPRIRADERKLFSALGKLGGDPAQVDTCDLKEFYRQKQTPSGYQLTRHERRQLERHLGVTAEPSMGRLGFHSFYVHLLRAEDPGGFVTGRELFERERRKRGWWNYLAHFLPQYTRRAEDLWDGVPAVMRSEALRQAIEDLCRDYPVRGMEVSSSHDHLIFGAHAETTFAVTILTALPAFGYRILSIRPDGTFFVGEISSKNILTLQAFDRSGKALWHFHADGSEYLKADGNIFGIRENMHLPDKGSFSWDKVPFSTNMTRSQWEALLKTRPSNHVFNHVFWNVFFNFFSDRIEGGF